MNVGVKSFKIHRDWQLCFFLFIQGATDRIFKWATFEDVVSTSTDLDRIKKKFRQINFSKKIYNSTDVEFIWINLDSPEMSTLQHAVSSQ